MEKKYIVIIGIAIIVLAGTVTATTTNTISDLLTPEIQNNQSSNIDTQSTNKSNDEMKEITQDPAKVKTYLEEKNKKTETVVIDGNNVELVNDEKPPINGNYTLKRPTTGKK